MQPKLTPAEAAEANRFDAQLEARSMLSSLKRYGMTKYDGATVEHTTLYDAEQVEALLTDVLAKGKEADHAA
jgi:dsDNA-binding SOS-regulon protein